MSALEDIPAPPAPADLPAFVASLPQREAAWRSVLRFVRVWPEIDLSAVTETRSGSRSAVFLGQDAAGRKFGAGYVWTAQQEADCAPAAFDGILAAAGSLVDRQPDRSRHAYNWNLARRGLPVIAIALYLLADWLL